MSGRVVVSVLLTLVLVAAIVGVGAYVYNTGVAQGLAQGGSGVERESGAVAYPYYGHYVRPFFGLGLFGLLAPLFFVFLIFGVVRAIFWRGPRHWGMMHHGEWGKHVPPMAEEWHRKMHEQPSAQPTEK